MVMLLFEEELMRKADELGPLPQSVTRLSALLSDPDYSTREVTQAIELDPTLAGRLLQMANSAIYAGTVSTVGEAVARVGGGMIRALAMVSLTRPAVDLDLSVFGLTPQSYWDHCVQVLSFSSELAMRSSQPEGIAATAALVHDYGKLILSSSINAANAKLISESKEARNVDAEMHVLGVNHAEVSAVVAQVWQLPDELVRAVQHHHDPSNCDVPLCHLLHVANQLAWRYEGCDDKYEAEAETRIDSLLALGIPVSKVNDIFMQGKARVTCMLDSFNAE